MTHCLRLAGATVGASHTYGGGGYRHKRSAEQDNLIDAIGPMLDVQAQLDRQTGCGMKLICEMSAKHHAGEELTEEVVAGLERAGLLTKEQVLFTDRSDEGHAYIVYTHGFEERRARSIDWLESVGVIPLGRFGRYDYHNSDQCVIAARELAATLLTRRSAGGQGA